MTENDVTIELKNRIAELEKELETAKNDTTFDELKEKYEKVIEEKNDKINELNKSNEIIKEKMETTVDNLNDEVKLKLEQSERLTELNKQVEELMRDKAEATVDKFITEGKILPAQKDTALKLCINDNDTFMELYENAKPIVETKTRHSRTIESDKINRIADYFKN